MSISDPTHPESIEDDDVTGHVFRRTVVPDEDVEGHSYRRSVVPDDDDVEGHGMREKA